MQNPKVIKYRDLVRHGILDNDLETFEDHMSRWTQFHTELNVRKPSLQDWLGFSNDEYKFFLQDRNKFLESISPPSPTYEVGDYVFVNGDGDKVYQVEEIKKPRQESDRQLLCMFDVLRSDYLETRAVQTYPMRYKVAFTHHDDYEEGDLRFFIKVWDPYDHWNTRDFHVEYTKGMGRLLVRSGSDIESAVMHNVGIERKACISFLRRVFDFKWSTTVVRLGDIEFPDGCKVDAEGVPQLSSGEVWHSFRYQNGEETLCEIRNDNGILRIYDAKTGNSLYRQYVGMDKMYCIDVLEAWKGLVFTAG